MKYKVRTPTKLVTHEKDSRDAFPSCAICKQPMHGMPVDMKNASKSQKHPPRAYAGYVCASCSKEMFKQRARSI